MHESVIFKNCKDKKTLNCSKINWAKNIAWTVRLNAINSDPLSSRVDSVESQSVDCIQVKTDFEFWGCYWNSKLA